MYRRIKDIYGHMGDETSRQIFADRLLFSLTGDRHYMTKIVRGTALYQKIHGLVESDVRRKYIASAGQWGKIIAELFGKSEFAGMIDNHAAGSYENIPILPLDAFLEQVSDGTVYIGSTRYHAEFCQMLKNAGVGEDRIVDVAGMMLDVFHRQQYFDLPFLEQNRKEQEIFVDGGCYDGENSRMFAVWAGDVPRTIYAFEPDETNFHNCRTVLDSLEGVSCHLVRKGLWSSDTVLEFHADANEGSRFADGGKVQIPVTRLDAAIEGNVTFIKLDVEGAEYEALKGAEKLIQNCRPTLAVSVYHKAQDIWELPELILSMAPEYTFYLRHYSLSSEETVLYAV